MLHRIREHISSWKQSRSKMRLVRAARAREVQEADTQDETQLFMVDEDVFSDEFNLDA